MNKEPKRHIKSSGPKGSATGKSRKMHILGRLGCISSLILLLAVAIIFMAVNNTIVNADQWNKKGLKHLDDTISIKPLRGDILACDGSILATNLNYFNLRIDFKAKRFMIREYNQAIDSLADSLYRYFPRRTRDEWAEYLRAPLALKASKRSSSYMLLKEIPNEDVERVKKFPYFKLSDNANRTGLVRERVLKRKYPYGDMANLSIGRVGEVANREVRGISGLECALDSLLYGTPGKAKKVLFTDRVGNWTIEKPKNGYTVVSTIDITMQDILEFELGNMLRQTQAEWGTALIMDVETGDIKAISNLERDTVPGSGRYIEAMNRAVLGYEPGSVVKAVSMIVALEDGVASPLEKMYHIEPKGVGFRYCGGKPINDTHSPSSLPVSRFLEYSSNIGMAKLITSRYENDPNAFRERLRELGFFDRFNTGIARERPPYYPTLQNNRGGRISLSRMAFGYTTMIPPLYTCAVYNAVANDGRFVRPRLVKGLRNSDGLDSIIPVSYVRDSICSRRNARIMREMLHKVVWGEGGTAKALKNEIVEIAGKTGTCRIMAEAKPKPKKKTEPAVKPAAKKRFSFSAVFANAMEGPDSLANLLDPKSDTAVLSDAVKSKTAEKKDSTTTEKAKPGGYLDGHYRLSFCGFFPYDKPKYTCMVMINDPSPQYRGAATTSGIVLKNVALKLYSRGMLDNRSELVPDENEGDKTPTLYASHNKNRHKDLASGLRLPKSTVISMPSPTEAGTVPDVRGLGMREAVVTIEKAGYNVSFSGVGFVDAQTPEAGTRAPAGSKVTISLKQN